jgi:3-(3-hydroxy-phenyl)propionate hydroxylase
MGELRMSKLDRILVVGAGPVGTVAGLRLAQYGFNVTVFERTPSPPDDHRAAALQPASHAIFEQLGIIDEIERQGLRAQLYQWRDRLLDEVIADFDFGILKDVSDYPYVIQLEQHKTVNIALAEASKFPNFEIVRPVEVVSVRQNTDKAIVDVRREDGSIEVYTGAYLIGCDGGRSLVRNTIDVSFDGFTWGARQLIVTTDYDFESAMNFRYRNFYTHPVRSCSLFKIPGEDGRGLWRSGIPVKPEESDDEALSDEWISAQLAECFPIGAPYRLLHKTLYNAHNRVARQFYRGRMILAGDAAHLNNPNGAMGMNSGLQDAMNIADKLKEIREGGDPETLLARYDRQRRLTAIEFVQPQSIAGRKLMLESDADKRREGMDRLRRIASDPAQHHDYLYKASLIAMQDRADQIN